MDLISTLIALLSLAVLIAALLNPLQPLEDPARSKQILDHAEPMED
jgi:predicted membrane protein